MTTALGGVRASALVARVREAADMEATQGGSSQFVTDSEIRRRIDESATDLYDKLISALGEDYFITTAYLPHEPADGAFVTLPLDFYRLISVHRAENTGVNQQTGEDEWRVYDALPFQRQLMTTLLNAPPSNVGPYFYRLNAVRLRDYGGEGIAQTRLRDRLEVYPLRTESGWLRVSYISRLQQATETDAQGDSDTDDDPIYPGINGWEEYVVLSVAIRLIAKEGGDTSDLRAERERIELRIADERRKRDVGRPERMQLTRKARRGCR